MSVLAIIPARGGSKRLPRKNVRSFAGRPLLVYSIEFARRSSAIDRCVVSTDDDETAGIAVACGVEVIHRPTELATDTASTASAVEHALRTVSASGSMPDVMVLLQPNCPLRPAGLAERALAQLVDSGADSVISVTSHHHKTGTIDPSGWFVPDYVPGTRSQDLAAKAFENGVIYATRSTVVTDTHSVFGARISPLLLDPIFALGDIDTALDWEIAEQLFHRHRDLFGWLTLPEVGAGSTPSSAARSRQEAQR